MFSDADVCAQREIDYLSSGGGFRGLLLCNGILSSYTREMGNMKMEAALGMISQELNGFMVSFEWCGDGFLRSDHFPDKRGGEKLIETEAEAWDLAVKFARATVGKTCNIYVIDQDFKPVEGWRQRKIAHR